MLARLGSAWVIRPVTAPIGNTLPCTLPSGARASSHPSTVFTRVSNIFHLARFLMEEGASDDTVSKFFCVIFACPFSVNSTGFQPNLSILLMICLGEPRLNGSKDIILKGPPTVSCGLSIACSPVAARHPSFLYLGVTSLNKRTEGLISCLTCNKIASDFDFISDRSLCVFCSLR